MFILPLLLLASQATIRASPIPIPSLLDTRDFLSVTDDASCSCPQLRSIWDIVWSCLATIFACTWVSIHPNSPGLKIARIRKILTRLELMTWTILIPELIAFWAFRQWLGARVLAARYKDFGWSTVHGHFLQMGGFVLVGEAEDEEILTAGHFHRLLREGKIRFPRVSEDEINSLSKGDWFSKMIVVCQTSWFIAQCISRAVNGLFITQLELITVAFAFLNALIYFLWWNKPLDLSAVVRVAICSELVPIPLSPLDEDDFSGDPSGPVGPLTARIGAHQHDNYEMRFQVDEIDLDHIQQDITCNVNNINEEIRVVDPRHSVDCDKHSSPETESTNPISDETSVQLDVGVSSTKHNSSNAAEIADLPSAHSGESDANLRFCSIYAPWFLLYDIVKRIMNRIRQIRMNTDSDYQGVNTFYSYSFSANSSTNFGPTLMIACIGAVFGAIHCAGWNFAFPSRADMLIWRISSVFIFAYPSIVGLNTIMVWAGFNLWKRHMFEYQTRTHRTLIRVLNPMVDVSRTSLRCLLIYLLARLILLIEAIITLRNLPKEAFAQTEWVQVFPHI